MLESAKSLRLLSACLVAASAMVASASAQEFKLNMSYQNAPNSWMVIGGVNPWVAKIEQATKGRVKIVQYPSQTLVKGADSWKGVKSGVTDIAWCFHGYWPGMTPNTDVVALPALPFTTAEKGSEVLWKLYEKYPVIQKEFQDVKVLLLYATNPYFLMTRKPVRVLEDMKGLKIRVTGGPPTDQVKALGAVPMMIPQPDNYDALDKGVIDGLATAWEPVHGFRFFEVASNYTMVPMSAVYFSFVMNKAKWNSLPKDIQDAIMSVSGLTGSMAMGKGHVDDAEMQVMDSIRAGKLAFNRIELSPDELTRWRKVGGEPVWEAWIKKMEESGHSQARELLKATIEMSSN
jgi:TRAP-type transport system periplasmic protein